MPIFETSLQYIHAVFTGEHKKCKNDKKKYIHHLKYTVPFAFFGQYLGHDCAFYQNAIDKFMERTI